MPTGPPRFFTTPAHYLLAVLWTALFAGLRWTMEPVLQGQAPLLALMAAPILSAWWGGLGPGLLATGLCAIAGELLFILPHATLVPPNPGEWLRLIIFLAYGACFSWLISTRRHALAQLKHQQVHADSIGNELARRERHLRDALEASPAGMLIIDAQGTIQYANVEAQRLFGHGTDELIGMSVDALVPEAARSMHAENRHRFHAAPSQRSMGAGRDLYARRRDGSVFPVEIGLNPLQGESAGLVLASVLDISARKQVENALRHSEQRAREHARRSEAEKALLDVILEAAPAGIILADSSGRLLRFNSANDEIWGTIPDTRGIDEYVNWKGWWADKSERHGQPVQPNEWAMARALRGEVVRDDVVEIEPFGLPGTRRTIVLSAAPVRGADGSVTGAVLAQMDASALVSALAALRESEAIFRSLSDNIAQLAWMSDEEGRIDWYNRRWFEFTGTTPEMMRTAGWEHFHHPDHIERVTARFYACVRTGEPWEDTFPLRGADGQFRWFLSRAFPLRDESGKVVRWFGTNTDITAQREAQDALRQADRRKDEFIAVLAHELRNPLAPVRNAVEILKRIGVQDPRVARARDILDRQVTHMVRLIDDLLDVSRVARGTLSLQKQACDLVAIVRDTTEDYRDPLEAAGLTLTLHLPAEPLWVHGDPVRLAQMLGNLLNNAERFTARGGRVDVSVVRDADARWLRLTVADTGEGITPELLSRLFDPFTQGPQDLARSKGGLGLGLALTQGLARLHDGDIIAQSPGPGQGARFTVRLPPAP